MAQDFVSAFIAARDMAQRRRQFEADNTINQGKLSVDQGELALRQAAEQRAAAKAQEDLRQRDYERFMGPAEGLKRSPYGAAAATDIGTLEEMWNTKDDPMEEPLPEGVQGPPTLQSPSGRQAAIDAARAGIEAKTGAMFDSRYQYPADARAKALIEAARVRGITSEHVAGITADSRIRSEQIKAGAKASLPARPAPESPEDKRYYAWVKEANPQLQTLRNPMGLSQSVMNRIKRTQALPESLNEALTRQEVTEFALGQAGALSGGGSGGQIAQRLVDELTPQTWKQDVAGWLQYVRNKPQDAEAQDFVRRGMAMLAREFTTANQSVLQGLKTSTAGYRDVLVNKHREKAEQVLKLGGLSDQQIVELLGPKIGAQVMMIAPPGALPEYPNGGRVPVDPDEVEAALAAGWTRDTREVR
jgi:hypothetical protein